MYFTGNWRRLYKTRNCFDRTFFGSQSMFKDNIDFRGEKCILYERIIGRYAEDCKTQKGGLSAAKTIPTTIMIYNEELPYNTNLYKFITHLHKLCMETGNKLDFILKPNRNKQPGARFLTKKVIRVKNLPKYFTEIVRLTGMRGAGAKPNPVMHSLRKTTITNLLRSGLSTTEVSPQTSHKTSKTFSPTQTYRQNLVKSSSNLF